MLCFSAAKRKVLRTFGGTPKRDPCSLWGLIWGHPRDRGYIMTIYKGYRW